jgi:hypothetical protein
LLILLVARVVEVLAVLVGFALFFATPSLAGASLQLWTPREVEPFFARAIIAMAALLLLIVALSDQNGMELPLLTVLGACSFVGGGLLYGLVLPGIAAVRTSKRWQEWTGGEVPVAVVLRDQGASDHPPAAGE